MRIISIKDFIFETSKYECKFDWPISCTIQAGDKGVVFKSLEKAFENPIETITIVAATKKDKQPKKTNTYYTTCFFEAFPADTFLRGEGTTIEEAEAKCWAKYQKVTQCKAHEPERRNRRDGYGFCKHCGMGKMYFEPLETCIICGVATYHFCDTDSKWYCKIHAKDIPKDKQTEMYKCYLKIIEEENKISE